MLGCAGTSLEGVVAKRLNRPYGPGQCGWQRLRTRITTEAVAGGITGPLEAPQELIVGRHGGIGRLRVVGRTIPLRSPLRRTLARTPARAQLRRACDRLH